MCIRDRCVLPWYIWLTYTDIKCQLPNIHIHTHAHTYTHARIHHTHTHTHTRTHTHHTHTHTNQHCAGRPSILLLDLQSFWEGMMSQEEAYHELALCYLPFDSSLFPYFGGYDGRGGLHSTERVSIVFRPSSFPVLRVWEGMSQEDRETDNSILRPSQQCGLW